MRTKVRMISMLTVMARELLITPAKNLWHCLGACQSGGTLIDWVMKAEGVSFRHGRRTAAERLLARG
jgi:DNA primase